LGVRCQPGASWQVDRKVGGDDSKSERCTHRVAVRTVCGLHIITLNALQMQGLRLSELSTFPHQRGSSVRGYSKSARTIPPRLILNGTFRWSVVAHRAIHDKQNRYKNRGGLWQGHQHPERPTLQHAGHESEDHQPLVSAGR